MNVREEMGEVKEAGETSEKLLRKEPRCKEDEKHKRLGKKNEKYELTKNVRKKTS
jgi:hypothetical protein